MEGYFSYEIHNPTIDCTPHPTLDNPTPSSSRASSSPDGPVRNILVTGGAGFTGAHFAHRIVPQYPNYNIYVFDKMEYCASAKNLRAVKHYPNFSFIRGDITSADFVAFILKEKRIDTIVHFAAQTHVDNSFGDSFEFTRTNVYGTHVLLEAARMEGIRLFLHVSTDEVYGEPNRTEDSILAPSNPYSATKAAGESMVMAYHKSFNLPTIITRCNNIYGPMQYPEKVIPKFISCLARGEKCHIHGDGSNSRHYIHASDVAEAMDTILHHGAVGQVYNIGAEFEISNLALARYLIKEFGLETDDESEHLDFVTDRAFNDQRYAIDCWKITALGWRPRKSFEAGIKETIAWYKEHLDDWWDHDISVALVPHPVKKVASLSRQSSAIGVLLVKDMDGGSFISHNHINIDENNEWDSGFGADDVIDAAWFAERGALPKTLERTAVIYPNTTWKSLPRYIPPLVLLQSTLGIGTGDWESAEGKALRDLLLTGNHVLHLLRRQ
ncbi:hypothetical protein HK097_008677 [Rhizophlyctis rosea]|uniref:NAD(P)-binding domain-containing protein n=1 Tax=Rhizophlyctis rosea TaxID=64517 RepID=A0AAD5SI35_9FUNG|nr:hypothetical protein HK097_008677 [Rhizophlyctis rosea]